MGGWGVRVGGEGGARRAAQGGQGKHHRGSGLEGLLLALSGGRLAGRRLESAPLPAAAAAPPSRQVCLSLLGTWSGGRGESWSPDFSTVLQVGRRGGASGRPGAGRRAAHPVARARLLARRHCHLPLRPRHSTLAPTHPPILYRPCIHPVSTHPPTHPLSALHPPTLHPPTLHPPTLHPPARQVLISIQSLILVDEPFYNEPGEGWPRAAGAPPSGGRGVARRPLPPAALRLACHAARACRCVCPLPPVSSLTMRMDQPCRAAPLPPASLPPPPLATRLRAARRRCQVQPVLRAPHVRARACWARWTEAGAGAGRAREPLPRPPPPPAAHPTAIARLPPTPPRPVRPPSHPRRPSAPRPQALHAQVGHAGPAAAPARLLCRRDPGALQVGAVALGAAGGVGGAGALLEGWAVRGCCWRGGRGGGAASGRARGAAAAEPRQGRSPCTAAPAQAPASAQATEPAPLCPAPDRPPPQAARRLYPAKLPPLGDLVPREGPGR